MKHWYLPALLALALIHTPALAQEEKQDEPTPPEQAQKEDKDASAKPVARSKSTKHQITVDGQVIKYTATVGWLILNDEKDEPIARFGYTAYTLDGVKDVARRPVTFAFNGGPGSASIWLHMGVLGPRRVVVTDGRHAPPPPVQIVDNEYTILDATDLVMIDPVGTGFSKPVGKAKGEDFWGVDQDVESVAEFIRRYVTDNGRWASPKYVLGESYGGIRGAALVNYLQSALGMHLNGFIMVSPYFSMAAGDDGVGMNLPHALYLSTFAATAWYHNALAEKPASVAEYMDEVERWAMETYLPALDKGARLSEEEKQSIAQQLGQYTGTSPQFWLRADLRVTHIEFLQELMRDRGLIAGRIDGRFSGPSLNALNDQMDYDPFFPAVGPAYTAAFRSYLHSELQFFVPDRYVVSGGLYNKWDWKHRQPGVDGDESGKTPITNVLPDIEVAMTMNPGLHLLVEQGRFDLATPTHALKYNLDQLRLPPEARSRIRVNYYDAGHMMYIHEESGRRFRESVVGFIRETDRL